MSQDSEEIKTIEQWRWSEIQGLELLVSAPHSSDFDTLDTPSFKTSTNHLPSTHPSHSTSNSHTSPNITATATEEAPPVRETRDFVETQGGGQVQPTQDMESSDGKKKKDGGVGGDAEKPASPPPSSAFSELFRFADGLDYFLMGIGTLGAFVHGCSLPLFLRFFADLVNSFGSNANNVDKMTQEVVKVKCKNSLPNRICVEKQTDRDT